MLLTSSVLLQSFLSFKCSPEKGKYGFENRKMIYEIPARSILSSLVLKKNSDLNGGVCRFSSLYSSVE